MDEFNISISLIYRLAADQATERWSECRFLAGLDSSIDGQNIDAIVSDKDRRYWTKLMNHWSKIADKLYIMAELELRKENKNDLQT